MMVRLHALRLRTKLSLVVVISTLMTSMLLFLTVTTLEYRDSRHRVEDRGRGLARVLALNVRAPLAFADGPAAARVLEGLGAVAEVRWSVVLDDREALVAAYRGAGQAQPAPADWRPAAEAVPGPLVVLSEPIVVDGGTVGRLVLAIDSAPVLSAMATRAVLMLMGAAVIGLLASAAAVKAQDGVVRPIVGLAEVMHEVSRSHAYERRVQSGRSDEVGALYAGFNDLLGELQAREATLQRQQDRLFTLAHVDAVTGLSNRHHFRVLLDEALTQLPSRPFAVLCLDLDRFKTVNDALGHDVGDRLLEVVGRRLRLLARESDPVARLGGDEFAMIIRGLDDEAGAGLMAERVLAALCAPVDIDGLTVPMGVSIGIALAPRDGRQPDLLLKNADLALYGAKAGGRGRSCFYHPGMSAGVVRRLQIERALRSAITLRQLALVFQPQLDLASGRITGFEALVRWRHPELGEVPPSEFIAVAEDAGLINDIGAWVLEQACCAAADWPSDLSVAVNLSAVQVMTQDLPALVRRALSASGLAPHRLEVEITESVLLNETEATLAQLHALNRLGVRIALDDFGTGYSSMAYLRRFPFDKLKIDRCFVKALTSEGDARVIVHAIIDMAAGLRMTTLAEGVEHPDELDALREEGCAQVQGYLVSRPIPRAEVADWLVAQAAETGELAAEATGAA